MQELDIFDEQLISRRSGDEIMLEDAFDNLASILRNPAPARVWDSSDATSEILHYLGLETPSVPDTITDPDARIEYLMRPSGAMRRRVELTGRWWKDSVDPYLAATQDGQVVALLPGRFGGYSYRAPDGRIVKINDHTAANISEDAYCFYNPFALRGLSLRDLATYLVKNARAMDFIYILAISLAVALLGLVLPYVNAQLYGTVIPSGIQMNILIVGFLLLGTAIGQILFGLARSLLLLRFSSLFIRVQNAAMMRVLALPASFYREYAAGEVANRMQNLIVLCQTLTTTVLTTGFTTLFSFVYLFQMSRYAPAMVAPGLAIIAATLLLSFATAWVNLRISRKRMAAQAKLSAFMFALISGMQKIHLTGAKKRAFAKWAANYREIGRLTYAPPWFLRLLEPLNLLITMGGSILLYQAAVRADVNAADYLAFMAAFGAISGAVTALGGMTNTVAGARSNLDMVKPLLAAAPETSEGRRQITTLSGGLEMNGVCFRYDADGPLILDDINIKIKPGEFVAIVGTTGSGKSTMLRLLLGFEEPESGGIYYDGHDLNSLDLRTLRQRIGVALQDGKLFAGSIFDNIIVTAPWKTLDDAWEAAEQAGIAADIRDMPMGMHTMITEGAGSISGGQRQRLLIARALISKPKLIFFDEATSALDNITQKHVAESVAALKATRIIIAHRLSTIKGCDRIIVLENGCIVEQGNYAELVSAQGTFYELIKRQRIRSR